MNNKNFISIGERALEDKQLESILPEYKNIYKQIEKMRRYAQEGKKEKSTSNVFSILGKRGAGKSSVLLHLAKNIKSRSKFDIVIPVIMSTILPDRMKNDEEMMGWILGNFKEEVESISKLDSKIRNRGQTEKNFLDCIRNEQNTELFKSYKKVLEQYRYTRQDYADILKQNYSGLTEYVSKTSDMLAPENEMKKRFDNFIDELVKANKRVSMWEDEKHKETTDKQPMVFLFLDDMDLTKQYCKCIVNLISRYLCHPNIIVFVFGDYEIFEMEQFMGDMRNSGLMELVVSPRDNNLLGNQLLNQARTLARDTLKKVMPPAYRYYLHKLSAKERLEFYYEEGSKSLKELMEEKFSKDKFKVINAYGLILDEMPRGVMNVYYVLHNMNGIERDEENKVKNIKEFAEEFKTLFLTIIRSSTILSKYEEEIVNCIQIKDNEELAFVNYERLIRKVDAKMIEKDNQKEKIKEKMVVLMLGHFIESVVNMVDEKRKVHGQPQVWDLVKKLDEEKIKIYPHMNKTEIIFNLYELMLSNDARNVMQTMDSIYLKDYSLKFYFEMLDELDALNKEKIVEYIPDISNEDDEWIKEKFQIVYDHRDPACMFINKALAKYAKHIDDENDSKQEILNTIQHKWYKQLTCIYEEKVEGKAEDNQEKYVKIIEKRKEEELDKIKGVLKDHNVTLDQEKLNLQFMDDGSDKAKTAEHINTIERQLSEYFSKKKISKKDEDTNIIIFAILFKAYQELEQMKDYEIDYFQCFEEWHQQLLKSKTYEEWIETNKESHFLLGLNKEVLDNQGKETPSLVKTSGKHQKKRKKQISKTNRQKNPPQPTEGN